MGLPGKKKSGEHDADAWYFKGFALNSLGKYDEAIKMFDKAIKIDPRDAAAWHNKGSALGP